MPRRDAKTQFRFDTASAISKGSRDYQEDAVISDFSNGDELGFVVLADGMGGHAAGDIASKIVVTEVFSELTFMRAEMVRYSACISDALTKAADQANSMLREHVEAHPDTKGMGATLVATVVVGGKLHWISIGDSPLFMFRDNSLVQLNENHSMSKTIDMMVRTGLMSAEDGENHPDRNVLTSVLFGEPVPEIDCPTQPMQLRAGDTLIVASDGLQFLSNTQIEKVLRDRPFARSSEIADALMDALKDLGDPDLDNVTLSVIQVRAPELVRSMPRPITHKRPPSHLSRPSIFQRVFRPDEKTQGVGLGGE
ncbi:MAG: protein phosphatase 2C domain-containing protein [Pseudomonadota bacterium]